jgi:hypothetical protein
MNEDATTRPTSGPTGAPTLHCPGGLFGGSLCRRLPREIDEAGEAFVDHPIKTTCETCRANLIAAVMISGRTYGPKLARYWWPKTRKDRFLNWLSDKLGRDASSLL